MKSFNDVIGYEGIKREMKMVCDALKAPEKYKRLGVTVPKGILLHGEPGIGKGLLAQAFIDESGRKCFTIRKDRPDGEFVNYIRETFETAKKQAPCIVFLDDMDKFAIGDETQTAAEEYVTVQTCIDEIKDYEIFVIATVNGRELLPHSLVRPGRFDKIIRMKAPGGENAERIIEHFLSRKQMAEDVDAKEIARILNGKSCAELETIVNEAGIRAAYAGHDLITHNDVIAACMRYIYGVPEEDEVFDEERDRYVAVHEAGHAVVAEMLDPGSVNLVSLAGRTSDIGGITEIDKPKDYWYSKEAMEHRVMSLLGGKAATEIKWGISDTGCTMDLQRAFEIAMRFSEDYCSSGFNSFVLQKVSMVPKENRDRMMVYDMERYYQEARKIIIANRDFFEALVEALTKERIVLAHEIQAIKVLYAH